MNATKAHADYLANQVVSLVADVQQALARAKEAEARAEAALSKDYVVDGLPTRQALERKLAEALQRADDAEKACVEMRDLDLARLRGELEAAEKTLANVTTAGFDAVAKCDEQIVVLQAENARLREALWKADDAMAQVCASGSCDCILPADITLCMFCLCEEARQHIAKVAPMKERTYDQA